MFVVEYKTFVEEDGSRPLREVIDIGKIRPRPPVVPFPAEDLSPGDMVDAFDYDGWWRGTICEKKGYGGDEIEVSSGEQGYLGSYYEARVAKKISKSMFVVEYKTLVEEDGSRPLREVIDIGEIRPRPPMVPFSVEDLSPGDKVDAFDYDGWWRGTICEKKGFGYVVHFHTTGETMTFPNTEKLRIHLDWVEGKWVSANFGYL
ncbi:DUF724 domain-containing protein 6-like [Carica papaya]|uniref:DUF724 domain-containing protein 6-like n=1 Tax=Carica papaya TaxID=3649 RepID=UPI000B8CE9BC|nr:DUF724 domain-containing protein 6-like [Carica papaya]